MYCRNVCNDFFVWETVDEKSIVFKGEKCNVSEILKKGKNDKISDLLKTKILSDSSPENLDRVESCGCDNFHRDKKRLSGIYVSYDQFLTVISWVIPEDYKSYKKIIFKRRLNFYSVTLKSLQKIINKNLQEKSLESNDVF